MTSSEIENWLNRLSVFRAELVDLAYSMDRRGRAEAADVAMMAVARIGEICEELQPRAPDLLRGTEPDEIKERTK